MSAKIAEATGKCLAADDDSAVDGIVDFWEFLRLGDMESGHLGRDGDCLPPSSSSSTTTSSESSSCTDPAGHTAPLRASLVEAMVRETLLDLIGGLQLPKNSGDELADLIESFRLAETPNGKDDGLMTSSGGCATRRCRTYSTSSSLSSRPSMKEWKVPLGYQWVPSFNGPLASHVIPRELEKCWLLNPEPKEPPGEAGDGKVVEREIGDAVAAKIRRMMTEGLTASNYRHYWTLAVFIEELEEIREVRSWTIEDAVVMFHFNNDGSTPSTVIRNLALSQIRLDVRDEVLFTTPSERGPIRLTVCKIEKDLVVFEKVKRWRSSRLAVEVDEEERRWNRDKSRKPFFEALGKIEFCAGNVREQFIHRALCQLPAYAVDILMGSSSGAGDTETLDLPDIDRFYNPSVASNPEQVEAVKSILAGSARPHPYILFGPPGTGKSTTLVEAIMQVLHSDKSNVILVTAHSNSAVDNLTTMLANQGLDSSTMARLASKKHHLKIPAKSKIKEYLCGIPPPMSMFRQRVICATMTMAGAAMGRMEGVTHVIIDEASQSAEPDSLIAMVGTCFKKFSTRRALLVLAGDPCQLGPVVTSRLAADMGLEISLMERLLRDCKRYQKDGGGHRNPRYITMLLRNFRSHPDLIHLPSKLFYDSELIAQSNGGHWLAPDGDEGVAERKAKDLEWVPRMDCPLIFHGVEGVTEHHAEGTSLRNKAEVRVVLKYVRTLRNLGVKDIGIITPYKSQVITLQRHLEKSAPDIMVGTTEEFQGQERSVVIVSSVRSSMVAEMGNFLSVNYSSSLGFLRNPKRFNVAVTRAKSLMIMVGDPHLLHRDRFWGSYLQFCIDKGVYKGCPFGMEDLRQKLNNNNNYKSKGKTPKPPKKVKGQKNVKVPVQQGAKKKTAAAAKACQKAPPP